MVRIVKDLDDSIEGEHVLLVEDIVDTGFTTRYLMQHLAAREPKSLAVCTLLDRTSRRIVQVPVDYRCFEIPDRFVVGFGMDYKQLYRNLKYVAVLNPEPLGELSAPKTCWPSSQVSRICDLVARFVVAEQDQVGAVAGIQAALAIGDPADASRIAGSERL